MMGTTANPTDFPKERSLSVRLCFEILVLSEIKTCFKIHEINGFH